MEDVLISILEKYIQRQKGATTDWSKTLAYKYQLEASTNNSNWQAQNSTLKHLKFHQIKAFNMQNGNQVNLGTYAFVKLPGYQTLAVVKVLEILQVSSPGAELGREPDLILVSIYKIGDVVLPYCMLGLVETNEYAAVCCWSAGGGCGVDGDGDE